MTDDERSSMARSLAYFWQGKGDLERMTTFDRNVLAREFPAVLKAWDDYKASRLVLDAVVRDMESRLG